MKQTVDIAPPTVQKRGSLYSTGGAQVNFKGKQIGRDFFNTPPPVLSVLHDSDFGTDLFLEDGEEEREPPHDKVPRLSGAG